MTATTQQRNNRTALITAIIGLTMLGLAFAAVPLYRMFCEYTGYDGTPLRAEEAPGAVAGQVEVRFDANVHPGMPWRFAPKQNFVRIAPGAKTQIFYRAQNLSAHPVTGQARFNVTPDTVGKYFNKIQCFCFSEQTLKPGQSVDMPVIFYVDPKMSDDPDTRDIHEITLSYTFYPVETGATGR